MADVTAIFDIMSQLMVDERMAAEEDIVTSDDSMTATLGQGWVRPAPWVHAAVRVEHGGERADFAITYYLVPETDSLMHASTTRVEAPCDDEDEIADMLVDVIRADLDDKRRLWRP